MPRLIRLYIVNVAIGFALAVAFTALLIGLDVGHLRHLVFGDRMGWVAVFMLVVFHTALFAGVQFAIAVMSMAEDGGGPRPGRRIRILPRLAPAVLKARAADRHR